MKFAFTLLGLLSSTLLLAQNTEQSLQIFKPRELNWKAGPADLPPGAKYVILSGDPGKEGFYTLRLKLPSEYPIPPHTNPRMERITVLYGTINVGEGARLNLLKGRKLEEGSYVIIPAETPLFAWTSEDTIIQIEGEGPWEIHYLDPKDDPRRQN